MALVEIEAGPHLVTAAITRDAVEELGLAPGVRGDRGGQGDLGDGRAGQLRRPLAAGRRSSCCRRRSSPRGCGVGDGCGQRQAATSWSSAAASLKDAFTDVRPEVPGRARPRSRSPAPTSSPRRSSRASSPTCSPPPTPSCPTSSTRRASSRSRSCSPATASCSPCPASGGKVARSPISTKPGVTLAIGSPSVPVGSYTRKVLASCPPARAQGDPRQRALQRARRRRASSASSRRAPSTPASSTSPTSSADRRQAEGDRAARTGSQPQVAYGVAVVEGRQAPGAGAGSSSTGCSSGAGAQALEAAGFEPPPAAGLSSRRWFPAALAAALAVALLFLTLPVVAIFVDTSPASCSRASATRARSTRCGSACETQRRPRWRSSSWSARPAAYLLATRRFRGARWWSR